MKNSVHATWLGAALLTLTAGLAFCQAFPNRTITVIVPYPAGGPTDVAARWIAPHMAATLGQGVIVENVSGASGTPGTARVVRAAPDGHTILVHNVNLAPIGAMDRKLPFDIEKDLVGVGMLNYTPFVLVGRKDHPANTLAELIAWMKANDRQIKFAHVGVGGLNHLAGALLAKAVGVEFNMIPYRGAAPVLTDLVAGHVDVYLATTASAGELIKSGAVKAFAITSRAPVASLPDLPSLVQSGHYDSDILYWQMMLAASATPKPVLDQLNRALRLALADPKIAQSFADAGTTIFPPGEQTPEGASAFLRGEIKRWGDVIRANKIEAGQ